jgi:S-formylglutathione hydrolase
VPWGTKAFTGYLGSDRAAWAAHDTVELVRQGHRFPDTILVDQGTSDKFLKDQLRPELLTEVCKSAAQPLDLRLHTGYDHGYFFIQSFIAGHMNWHGQRLTGNASR